jgi:gluconate 2-dehydrogenase alpha chain
MSTKLPGVDVLLVGFGWTGAIMAEQLTQSGLKVLALEAGRARNTDPDFAYTQVHDELRYGIRQGLMMDPAKEAMSFRHNPDEPSLPVRHWGSFLPGTGVGGAGVHWNGQTYRFLPTDFQIKSNTIQRYGAKAIPDGMTIQDWGVSYDELEPHFNTFEYLCGVSGKAGNLNGVIQPGGNPFEGRRSQEYPTPPQKMHAAGKMFGAAASGLGYHPFPQPSSNLSQPYKNPLGVQQGACAYCGYCERYACEMYAKSSPQTTILPVLTKRPNFELRTGARVTKVNLDSTGKRAVSVSYVDQQGNEFEQPAELVILCAFILWNVRLLLLSGIGKPYDYRSGDGVIGKNYAYQMTTRIDAFFKDKPMNPFMGSGALGMIVDDFNGDNFDHSGLGFIGGGYIGLLSTGTRPIEQQPVPDGTPAWGSGFKKALKDGYPHSAYILTHGGVMSYRDSFLDLDPTYKDAWGQPLLRMTFDFHDNEHKMSDYLTDKAVDIAKAMNPSAMKVSRRHGPYDITAYQTTHNTGGAIMGANPRDSAVNRYLQSWDVPNVFVMGASAFPQNHGYNPTDTLAALAYFSAKAIREQYLPNPGPLVRA